MARSTLVCPPTKWRVISLRLKRCGQPCRGSAPLLDLLDFAPLPPDFPLHFFDLLPDRRNLLLHLGNTGVALAAPQLVARFLGDLAIAVADAVELVVLQLLEVEQHVVPALRE